LRGRGACSPLIILILLIVREGSMSVLKEMSGSEGVSHLIAKETPRPRAKRPADTKRCPAVPERFPRTACWKRCPHWDKRRRLCRVELRERVDAVVEGRRTDEA
jgi:hypothetical protein